MATKQKATARITLRDVIEQMNHRFDMVDSKFIAMEARLVRRMDSMEVNLLERIDAEANAADRTMELADSHEKRLKRIEKHLALPRWR